MQLECQRSQLITAFQIVSGVVPTRTTKEILRNVKFQVDSGKATLIGTDLEVGIRYELEGVQTESAGELLLPTARLLSILRELTDDTVKLEVSENAVEIISGHSRFRLSLEDPNEFPRVQEFSGDAYYTIEGKTLKDLIRRSIFAADDESTRYALGGVLVELSPNEVTFAATDSRRLAVVSAPCEAVGVDDDKVSPVIPRKAMQLIERSLSDDSEPTKIAAHGNEVLIQCGQSTIYSRLVEGRFPNYRDVIPTDAAKSVELVCGPFYSAVRQAQIVTSEESRGVDFVFSEGNLTLKSQAADVGESTIDLPISFEGETISVLFDPRLVAEFLRVLEPETALSFDLTGADDPAVFRCGERYTYVVMPLSRD